MRPFLLAVLILASCLANAAEPMSGQAQRKALLGFVAKKKFTAEALYPGATNEPDRLRFEAKINALARRVLPLADQPNPKAALLDAFSKAYPDFEEADTEDRERALLYFQELMEILGVESSDGLLNKLMYGFDPDQSLQDRNREALAAMTPAERALLAQLTGATAANAEAKCLELFGQPAHAAGGSVAWLPTGNANNMVTFTRTSGKARLVWLVHGRFMYMHAW